MLDNRYEFDYETGDRLGPDQWKWLENSLNSDKNVSLTVIGAGIQMIPDRHRMPIESFGWKNKKRLFKMLKEHEMERVVLLSGDVHFGAIYENKCRSLTG